MQSTLHSSLLTLHSFQCFPESRVGYVDGFGAFDSPLGQHPDHRLIPGVEISSGSLGHGLPLGVGAAHALAARGSPARVIVLVGDAEMDEGSAIEAVEYAGEWDFPINRAIHKAFELYMARR